MWPQDIEETIAERGATGKEAKHISYYVITNNTGDGHYKPHLPLIRASND